MRTVCIIPSRLKSVRVPNKALIDIEGLPMIVHVYNRVKMQKILDDVIVATDSEKIKETVELYGGKALITSCDHKNGTLRVCEVADKVDADCIVVVMGDEALVNFEYIKDCVETLKNSKADASVLVNKFYKFLSPSDFKVVLDKNNYIMYISRNDIPSNCKNRVKHMLKMYHISAFKKETLDAYKKLDYKYLDNIEDHEFLRLLENGYRIKAKEVESTAVSLDTYEDYEFIKEQMKTDRIFEMYKDIINL